MPNPKFSVATQVHFWDGVEYKYGIAFNDTIICACCGGIFSVDEVIEEAPIKELAIKALQWVDFEYAILVENPDELRIPAEE